MSLVKRIAVRSGEQPFDIELRAEASNVFNRTLFGAINVPLTEQNFGRPTALQVPPRFIQMAIKSISEQRPRR